jgi:hypothetical protein
MKRDSDLKAEVRAYLREFQRARRICLRTEVGLAPTPVIKT